MGVRYLSDLVGTLQTYFKIGTIRLRQAGISLYVRDAGDTAYADIEVNRIRIRGDNFSSGVGLDVADGLAALTTYVLPEADGEAGDILSTDGSANLSFKPENSVVEGVAGENLTIRNLVYQNPSDYKWYKIDADYYTGKIGENRGIAIESITSGNTGTIRTAGVVSGFSGLTAGDDVWAYGSAGSYTQIKYAVTAGQFRVVCRIGYAASTTEVMVERSPCFFMGRESLDSRETEVLYHYPDPASRNRKVNAYAFTNFSDLTTNAVAYWDMDETSGTRYDAAGSNDLADNGTVTYDTGMISNCAHFDDSTSEYLSIADNTDLSMGDVEFMFMGWFSLDDKTASQVFFSKGSTSSLEYSFSYNSSTDEWDWSVRDTANTTTTTASFTGTTYATFWYFCAMWHDPVADEIGLKVGANASVVESTSGGVRDSTNAFNVGRYTDGTAYLDGRVDELGLWKGTGSIFSEEQINFAYNGASGISYSGLAGFDDDFEEQLTVGRWHSGTRDIAVRYDSMYETYSDTRTAFKNVSGEALDAVLVVELP